MVPGLPKKELVQDLARQLQTLQRLQKLQRGQLRGEVAGHERVSTGIEALDDLLPLRGLSRGTLVEWLAAAEGGGAGTLALMAAREACGAEGTLVVLDDQEAFYPPAAAAHGIDLARTVVVRPATAKDQIWALDQTLRSAGVSAVLCWLPALESRTMRRFQLSVESGGALGLLIRPALVRTEPAFAEFRFLIEPLPSTAEREVAQREVAQRQVRIELLRGRGTGGGQSVILEINEETGEVQPKRKPKDSGPWA